MAIDKHGLKMTGLKAAAGATRGLRGYHSGEYVELFYDRQTGEVWTVYQCSLGQNTWTEYRNQSVIKIGNISSQCSMQYLADLIYKETRFLEAIERGEITA